jgi:hypothetical protein
MARFGPGAKEGDGENCNTGKERAERPFLPSSSSAPSRTTPGYNKIFNVAAAETDDLGVARETDSNPRFR